MKMNKFPKKKSKFELTLKEIKEIIDKNKMGEKNLENFYNLQNKMTVISKGKP